MIPLLLETEVVQSIQFGTNGKLSGQEKQTILYNGGIVHGKQLELKFLSAELWKEQLQPEHPNNQELVFVLKLHQESIMNPKGIR